MSVYDAAAQRIEHERNRRGLTYEQVAVALRSHGVDVHFTAIHKVVKGRRRVTVEEIAALASVFEMSIDDLLRPLSDEEERLRHQLRELDDQIALLAAQRDHVAHQLGLP